MVFFKLHTSVSYSGKGPSGKFYIFRKNDPIEVTDPSDEQSFRNKRDRFALCDKDGKILDNTPIAGGRTISPPKSYMKIAGVSEAQKQVNQEAAKTIADVETRAEAAKKEKISDEPALSQEPEVTKEDSSDAEGEAPEDSGDSSDAEPAEESASGKKVKVKIG